MRGNTGPVRNGSLPLNIDLIYHAWQAHPHEYAADFIGSTFGALEHSY